MENFLIEVVLDKGTGNYQALFSNGYWVELDASNYTDAICEADLLVSEI